MTLLVLLVFSPTPDDDKNPELDSSLILLRFLGGTHDIDMWARELQGGELDAGFGRQ
jgi:hypothetical protein